MTIHHGGEVGRHETRATHDVALDVSGPAEKTYDQCPGAPDATLFSAHGLSMVGDGSRVLAVHHGGRESVEVFDVDLGAEGPRLTWVGCVVFPEGKVGNSVVTYGEDRFLATVPQDEGTSTGGVYAWTPEAGWDRLEDLAFEGNNGILVSPDGQHVYIAEWSAGTVVRAPLDGDDAVRRTKALGFLPDNLRFAPDGTILATGQSTAPLVVAGLCNMTSIQVCPVGTAVTRIDPSTLEADPVLEVPRTSLFGGGTSAIEVGDELLVSSFRSPSILIIPRHHLTTHREGTS